MELLVLKLSALEKDCFFVNFPDGSLPDIARLLQTIRYILYLRQSATQKKNHLFQLFKKPPPFSVLFLLCRIIVKLLHKLPEWISDCKYTDLHYSIHEKQSTLSRSVSFQYFLWLLNFSMSGRHKTEAKYIAAIKLKCETFFDKYDI